MDHKNKIADIPDEWVKEVAELEKRIKKSTAQNVVCIVYEKSD